MELQYNDKEITFIIDNLFTVSNTNTGGAIALTKLIRAIASRGYLVYQFNKDLIGDNIYTIPVNSYEKVNDWDTYGYIWEPFSYNPSKTVTLYNQITFGNPFCTVNNGRWLLHKVTNDHITSYDTNEPVWYYAAFMDERLNCVGELTIFNFFEDIFFNKNKFREGICYLEHKNVPTDKRKVIGNIKYNDITHLHLKNDLRGLAEEFNKHEYLITFDEYTFLSIAATMCGCKTIILDQEKYATQTQFITDNKYQKYGIAYGFQNITWANKTVDLVWNMIADYKKEEDLMVESFINYWTQKIINKP